MSVNFLLVFFAQHKYLDLFDLVLTWKLILAVIKRAFVRIFQDKDYYEGLKLT